MSAAPALADAVSSGLVGRLRRPLLRRDARRRRRERDRPGDVATRRLRGALQRPRPDDGAGAARRPPGRRRRLARVSRRRPCGVAATQARSPHGGACRRPRPDARGARSRPGAGVAARARGLDRPDPAAARGTRSEHNCGASRSWARSPLPSMTRASGVRRRSPRFAPGDRTSSGWRWEHRSRRCGCASTRRRSRPRS